MRELVGPVPQGRDPEQYDKLRRRVLWLLPTGLYVMGTRAGDELNLMTISWVTQVALEPKLVAVSVEHGAVTRRLLEESGGFTLSLLAPSERALVRKFVKPVEEHDFDEGAGSGRANGVALITTPAGRPVLEAAVAWLECEVRHRLVLGSHVLYAGEVVDCGSSALSSGGAAGSSGPEPAVLQMRDTRMNYGG